MPCRAQLACSRSLWPSETADFKGTWFAARSVLRGAQKRVAERQRVENARVEDDGKWHGGSIGGRAVGEPGSAVAAGEFLGDACELV
jgi:hypothetical protein